MARTAWQRHRIDRELAFLEQNERFSGTVTRDDARGVLFTLYYGAGSLAAVLEPSLNPFDVTKSELSPERIESLLSKLPASNATFVGTVLFAIRMREPALRSWLSRNDPAGFVSASLLAGAAMVDARLTSAGEPPAGEGSGFSKALVRLPSGNPNALALLARQYAKAHPIPKAVPPR